MTTFTQDQWIILALVFVLGMLIGMFLTAGGRRKWRGRYKEEVVRREAIERQHGETRAQFDAREKEWREQDSLRNAAARDRVQPTVRDVDGDGVSNVSDRRPTDDRKA
ncbi:MAG: hypothetical protein ABIW16_03625 [Sphingomicrobium sp.]